MNNPLHDDPEYQAFWRDYSQIGRLAERGMVRLALQGIQELVKHPHKTRFDPGRSVDYTHAVLLLHDPSKVNDVKQSVSIFNSILEASWTTTFPINVNNVKIELASALVLLGEFEEAISILNDVIATSSIPEPLALQNLGRAQFELGRLDEAESTHLKMIDASLSFTQVGYSGIAAEWLSRIELKREKRAQAAAWRNLARDVYREHSPQHLPSLILLSESLGEESETDLSELPPQAAAIRLLVPPAGELGSLAGEHLDELYVDVGALGLGLASPRGADATITIHLPIGDATVHERLAHLLMAEFDVRLPHSWASRITNHVAHELWPEWCRDQDVTRLFQDAGEWSYIPAKSEKQPAQLVWSTPDATAAVYGAALRALAMLFLIAFESRRRSLDKFGQALGPGGMSSLQLIDLSARAWPRPVDQRFIGYGQGLFQNTQGIAVLASELTRKRLESADLNKNGLGIMKFAPSEAQQLHDGGLIALLASEICIPGAPPPSYIGTTPLNELNIANLPPTVPLQPDESRPGFVIDREYNTWFFAPPPKDPNRACYGAKNDLLRDHFTPFQKQVKIIGTVRAKHFAIPIVDVPDFAALRRIDQLLCEATERLKPTKHVEEDARIMYRGQCTPYALRRSEAVLRFLYGNTNVVEPSVPGAAPRRGWNYHKTHSFLSTMLQALIYRKAAAQGEPLEETHHRWAMFSSNPGDWDLGVMLLAQHYGVPTHGIDITHDLDVALWFATNRFTPLGNGAASYRRMASSEWGQDALRWPVIYAILPVTHSLESSIRDVDLLAPFGLNARRPIAQKASFFMGAHGLHRNRLAEALVCMLRLRPSSWDCMCTYKELFPSPADDEVYSWMLDLKKQHSQGDIGSFLAEVSEYSYE